MNYELNKYVDDCSDRLPNYQEQYRNLCNMICFVKLKIAYAVDVI